MEEQKCVMVVDASLPAGLLANVAAILGISLGREQPGLVGTDVQDAAGLGHMGIVENPVPILKGDAPLLHTLRERLYGPEFGSLTVVDFSTLAQSCKTYGEYIGKMQGQSPENLHYTGLALCGPKKLVNKLTGSLPLLR